MGTNDTLLQHDFDNYNNCPAIPQSFLDRLNDDNSRVRLKELADSGKLPQKIHALKRLIAQVENKINAKLAELDIGLEKINLSSNATVSINSNDPKMVTKITIKDSKNSTNKVADFSVNISLNKMMNYPAEEIYSAIFSLAYNSLVSGSINKTQAQSSYNQETISFISDDGDFKTIDEKNNVDSVELEKNIIVRYIKRFLRDFFSLYNTPESIKSKPQTSIYNEVSNQIATDFGLSGVGIESLLDTSILTSAVNDEMILNARTKKIERRIETAREQENDELVATYSAQTLELLANRTKEDFAKVKFGAESTGSKMENFAKSFITEILAKENLSIDSLNLTFKSNIYPGCFYPPNTINVDVSKIDNITDFTMTLSHETKHFIDNVKGSSNDNKNRGPEVTFEYSEVQSLNLDKSSPEYKLLAQLNATCYHLDPSERDGRLAEIHALRFIGENSSGNLALKTEVSQNIEQFNNYQEKTIKMGTSLIDPSHKNSLQNLKRRVAEMKRSGQCSQRVIAMMEERLEYLEELVSSGLEFSAESQSIITARNIDNKMNGRHIEPVYGGPSF